MSRSPHHPIQLRSMDLQDALAPLPLSSSPLPSPLPPPQSAVQNPSSHLWASQCGPPPWGLSCLLALQHILVLASLLCASHLLLLQGLPPGELSSSPAQLLASSFFSCGVSTILQIWIGSRLPLVQAPSLEFLVPALVLTQKLPLAIQTPGNSSLVLRRCGGPGCPGLALWNTSLREVSGAVVVSGLLQGTLGLLGGPGHLFPHCGPLVLAPSLVVAGFSAHREVALFCSTHWGLALLYVSPERCGVVTSGLCGTWGRGESSWPYPTQQPSEQGQSLVDLESRILAGFVWPPWLLHCPPLTSPQDILLPLFSGTPFNELFHSYLYHPAQEACFLLLLKLLLSPRLILLVVVCSQHLGSCQVPPCPWRPASNSSPHTPIPVFRLFSVLVPVACVWIISALLGLHLIPLELAASPKAPWVWLPHPAEWTWPLLTPRALAAGISMALAASTSSLGCYALCGRLLQLPSPPPHACSRGLSLEGLGSVLAGMLGSPMGTASSFPNVGTVSLIQAGSRRVAHLAGLLCVGLGLSPRLAQLLTAIPLPVLGGVLGVTQAVVLSTGFSSFHLADIDSGRNVFIVGFSIFMALLLPRWLREAPVLMSTGWSPLDVLLRSLLTEPIFLAGLLGFLLENTIPGTRLERGLGQGMPSPFAAPKAQMPEKSREKGAKEYELPLPIQKLHPCIPQPLRCLCPLPEDPGNEEGGPSEPGETADLLPGFGEQCPESSRELGSQ